MSVRSVARAAVYGLEKSWQLVRFRALPAPQAGWPVLLGISFPKSGTHLLDQILLGFSKVAPFSPRLHSFYAEYEGDTGRKRTRADALQWLNSLRARDVASAHLFARPQAMECVTRAKFMPFFIFRDPRDVAVSHVFYVTDMEQNHVHHDYYASLPDFDSRLKVSILGRPDVDIEFPDIAARFEPYLGWLDRPEVLKLHFEDLVNNRRQALGAIADRFLARIPLSVGSERLVDLLESAINPGRSVTYRSGKTGEWRKYFKPEHNRLFKDVSGDLLVRLGYEAGSDW
jgi:hypothetical protein